MIKKPEILFIAAWYPHRYDPLWGLFVQKHAEAINQFYSITVLYIHADEKLRKPMYDIEVKTHNDIIEIRVYYKQVLTNIPLISSLVKGYRYLTSCYAGYKSYRNAIGKPALVHVHVLTRSGILAWYLRKFHKIPYIITEHWSRYLPDAHAFHGFFRKAATKIIVKNADCLTAVTENLLKAMNNHQLKNPESRIINNTVDIALFSPLVDKKPQAKKRILHVSCFEDKSKNLTGIIHAITRLSSQRDDFELHLVGEGMDYEKIYNLVTDKNLLQKVVLFKGAKFDKELVKEYQEADFLLLFSNYENMPVVINEAFSCGIPVLSTNVGGIAEHIDSKKGLLVEAGNENDLIEKLSFMLDHYQDYNRKYLRQYAVDNFSYENVGRSFASIYEKSLKTTDYQVLPV